MTEENRIWMRGRLLTFKEWKLLCETLGKHRLKEEKKE